MHLRLFLFLACICPAFLHAQSAGSAELQVRFLAERSPSDLGDVVLAVDEVRTPPFKLPINHLSAAQAPPARVFNVWSVAKNISLAKVGLPEKGKSFIVLLVPSPAGGYKPVIISAEDPAFKAGDVYFYNHADKPVLGYVGSAKFVLDASKGTVLRPAGAKENLYYDVGFGVREKEGDRVLSTTRWPIDKNMRSYVFFFLNPTSQRLDFRAVDEFMPPTKAAS
jgi:hypothetical protein